MSVVFITEFDYLFPVLEKAVWYKAKFAFAGFLQWRTNGALFPSPTHDFTLIQVPLLFVMVQKEAEYSCAHQ